MENQNSNIVHFISKTFYICIIDIKCSEADILYLGKKFTTKEICLYKEDPNNDIILHGGITSSDIHGIN